jgi:hypothetical protein
MTQENQNEENKCFHNKIELTETNTLGEFVARLGENATMKEAMALIGFVDTLKLAMNTVASNSKKGVRCPCCNGHVKVYNRAINSSQATCLWELYKISEKYGYRFYHLSELMERSSKFAKICNGGEFARLRHWGFIVEQPKSDIDRNKKTSGFWLLSDKGKSFCKGQTTVRKSILLLNNNVLGFDGNFVNIGECFDEKFTYDGIMGEVRVSESTSVITPSNPDLFQQQSTSPIWTTNG